MTPSSKKKSNRKSSNEFTFDRIFDESSTTKQVYEKSVLNIIKSSIQDGINGTIFAYGQTSCGKTFTMKGESDYSNKDDELIDSAGIVQFAAHDIFSTIDAESINNKSFNTRVSFIEIYNEEVRDLLSETISKKLNIYEDPRNEGGIVISKLKEVTITNKNELFDVLKVGERNKAVASTLMNNRSSRSHTIFRLIVEKENKIRESFEQVFGDEQSFPSVTSTLNFVDLAGSESVRCTGATGERQKEGGKINQR